MMGLTGRGLYNLYDTHSLYGWAETVKTREAMGENLLEKI
jgi:hypothetical protein